MDKLFLVHKETEYTYEKLRIDLNAMDRKSSYVYVEYNDPYRIFLAIIHSLVHDYSIEVLDGDFTEGELHALGVNTAAVKESMPIKDSVFLTGIDDMYDRIAAVQNWSLTLYTSGTTGRPKKVTHSFAGLSRNVQQHQKFADDVWGFAYNPSHMAGLQVFLQALLNNNTIVYMFAEPMNNIASLLKRFNITSVSATATFYRNALPYINDNHYPSVKRVTFGGEKYDVRLSETLKFIFPNATIRNIYASTEAGSLFSGEGEIFEIKEHHAKLVKISEDNELLIHHSLLGKSSSYTLEGEWFHTGDVVEQIGISKFKFTARQTDFINIGGYKVNPVEVENVLEQIPGVNAALVKGRKNSVTGELLVADVVKDDGVDEDELKKAMRLFAAMHLQEWKIPRIVKFVHELPMTRTGKKVRQ